MTAQTQQKSVPAAKAAVALVLTFAAGCVDIIGFLAFYHTFTAHMTGVTVHLGNDLLDRHWEQAAQAAAVVLAFVIGSVVGRTVIEVGTRKRISKISSAALLLEVVLIGTVALVGDAHPQSLEMFLLPTMLAAAMGVQTATLTKVGPLTVHTTFVTGMVNKLAELIAHAAFLTYDANRRGDALQQRRRVLHQARFMFSIWAVYLLGAVAGSWLSLRRGVPALIVPVAILACVIVADQIRPLSILEESAEAQP